MAKYINKITGNIVVPKHPTAEKLIAGSDNYEIVKEKAPKAKAADATKAPEGN